MLKITKIKEKGLKLIPKFILQNKQKEKYFPKKLLNNFLKETNLKYMKELYRTPNSIFIKATENNKLLGILYGRYDYGIFWIEFLCVKKENRREKIATKLLKELERICKKRKLHKIHTDIPITNIPSIKTFKKNNYFMEAKMKKHWLKVDYYLLSKFI